MVFSDVLLLSCAEKTFDEDGFSSMHLARGGTGIPKCGKSPYPLLPGK